MAEKKQRLSRSYSYRVEGENPSTHEWNALYESRDHLVAAEIVRQEAARSPLRLRLVEVITTESVIVSPPEQEEEES